MQEIVLKTWQTQSLSKFLDQKKLFLEWDVGTGKTFFMVYCIAYLQRKYPDLKTLIIAPPKSFPSISKTFEDIGITDYDILDTSQKKGIWLYLNYKRKNVCVMSSGTFPTKKFVNFLGTKRVTGALVDFKPDFIILDESHIIKSEKSEIAKKVKAYFDTVDPQYRLMGSGTPIGNNELEIFNQIYCLDKTILGDSFYAFRNKYFINVTQNKGFNTFKIHQSLKDEFMNKVAPFKTTKKIEDTGIELPDRHYNKRNFDMYEEQKQIYMDLKNKLVVEFKEGEIKMKEAIKKNPAKRSQINFQWYQNVLSQMSSLRQVCNGFVYEKIPKDISKYEIRQFIKNRKVMKFKTPKIDALRNGLIQIKDKILLWSVFIETFNQIEELLQELNLTYVVITGKTPIHKRSERVNFFKENPNCKVFLSHPKSGGTGLNLPEAKYSIFYSQDFSFIDKVQSEGRNFRINSMEYNSSIHYYEFLMKNSIETYIKTKIENKRKMADDFKNYLKQ